MLTLNCDGMYGKKIAIPPETDIFNFDIILK